MFLISIELILGFIEIVDLSHDTNLPLLVLAQPSQFIPLLGCSFISSIHSAGQLRRLTFSYMVQSA